MRFVMAMTLNKSEPCLKCIFRVVDHLKLYRGVGFSVVTIFIIIQGYSSARGLLLADRYSLSVPCNELMRMFRDATLHDTFARTEEYKVSPEQFVRKNISMNFVEHGSILVGTWHK